MFAGVGDHVGALLSLVTSGVPFEDAAMGLTVLYEESLPSAATTLKNLLEGGLLFSTVHKLQALALMFVADSNGSKSSLSALAGKETSEPPAVKSLATLLLEEQGSGLPDAIRRMSPLQFLNGFSPLSNAAPDFEENPNRQSIVQHSNEFEETLDSLGIAEFPSDQDTPDCVQLLRAAAAGPLLPREQTTILGCLHRLGQVEEVATKVQPMEIAAAAQHNPAVAAEAIVTAHSSHCSNSERGWAHACLFALARETTSINTISCWASLLDRVEIEPEILASYIFGSIKDVTGLEDRIARNRLARILSHFLHQVLQANISAMLISAVEVEGLCTQFMYQRGYVELYAKLMAMQ